MQQASQYTKKVLAQATAISDFMHMTASQKLFDRATALCQPVAVFHVWFYFVRSRPNPKASSNILSNAFQSVPFQNFTMQKWLQHKTAACFTVSRSLSSEFRCNYNRADFLLLSEGRRSEQGCVRTLLSPVAAAPPRVHIQQVVQCNRNSPC